MRYIIVAIGFLLASCAGKATYDPPTTPASTANTALIESPLDDVWKTLVRGIGKQFFVINNLDKDSGLINVSYRGDPTLFVDCGRINSNVENLRGKRNYNFAAASPAQTYEVMNANRLFVVNRTMDLVGRANVVVQDEGVGKTRVTVNSRYVLTRTSESQQVGVRGIRRHRHRASFNTGQRATVGSGATQITCVPNGDLERKILDLAHR